MTLLEIPPVESTQLEPPAEKTRTGWKSFLLEVLQTLVLAVILYFGIDALFARVKVLNISMQPTFYEGDVILVSKMAYKLGAMHTGDVVIFHNPHNLEEDYIKRLIGTPGDTVQVTGGEVYVNGNPLNEPYIAARPEYDGSWQVPKGQVFVLGDNRNQSSDSHSWGFVPLEDIVGKALVVYWPPNAMTIINHVGISN